MRTLKISNSSCQSQRVDNLLAILVPRGFANEIDDLAASTISGGASIGVVATAEGFGDATVWTITSSKSTPEGATGMGTITIGTTPSIDGTSYRLKVGDKSIEFPVSHFFKQKFEGRQDIYNYYRSLLNSLFAR
ncbi:hypothetical protein [Chamaesiphon sp. VAR_48_metabat_403]|uniref:hypothetical protein n=1 Tax=Chamaesiphon sp. VAR_48_metabat_403 TaxID=2964700 RepID=UPI00286DA03B|nr:hypothetical protein [Chamaesiphon sp. VAR_48_metabat_403]